METKFYLLFEKNMIYPYFKKVVETEDDKDIKKFVGFDFDYEIDFDNTYSDFSILLNDSDFEDIAEYERGVFDFMISLTSSYRNYDYNVDDSELNYLYDYINNENIFLIKKLLKLLDIKKEMNDEILEDLFRILSTTEYMDYGEIIYEISEQASLAIIDNAEKALKKLPFEPSPSYNSKYDYEFDFIIHDMIEYIKKNKLKDIKTVYDLLVNVDYSEISDWSIEYEYRNFDYDFDYSYLNELVNKQLTNIIKELESEKDTEFKDPAQLNLFQGVDDEIVKKISNNNNYKFQYNIFKDIKIDNNNLASRIIYYARNIGGKIFAWFKSYECQKQYISKSKNDDQMLDKYKFLEKEKILHPAIEYEYGHLDSVAKFNL